MEKVRRNKKIKFFKLKKCVQKKKIYGTINGSIYFLYNIIYYIAS